MKKFIEELKRRNVIKSALAYLVVVWVLLQIFSILLPIVNAPEWILQGITLLMAIGLPIWIIVSWIYDITPKGIEKTSKDPEDKLVSEITNKRLNVFIIAGLSIAVVVLSLNLFVFTSDIDKQYAIAVLPFESMNNDQDDNFFVDGMAMDIHTYLSKIKGLRVISDKTIMKFRGSDKTNQEIAKELGVDYLIHGNVRKHDDEIRITAQLIDANDTQVWAEPYTRKFVDIFKLQQDVSKEIAEQLKVELTPEEEKILNKFPTENMEAYNLFLEGRVYVLKRGAVNLEKALKLFQQAVDLDPNYAAAYAEIGYCYYLRSTEMLDGEWTGGQLNYSASLPKMNLNLEKALQINPSTFRAYAVKALIAIKDGLIEEAKQYSEKALAINPNDAEVNLGYSLLFSYQPSEIENRLKYTKIAQQLEPFSVLMNNSYQKALLQAGKFQEAENHLSKMGFLFPEDNRRWLESAILISKNKDWTEAFRYYEKELKNDPDNIDLHLWLGLIHFWVLHDNVNYLKYMKRAFEIEPSNEMIRFWYHLALCENKKFKEAYKLIHSIDPEGEELAEWIFYHLYTGNYKKAMEILNEPPVSEDNAANGFKVVLFALLDDRENVNKLIDENNFTNQTMAETYAVLEEKDSMYHYLDKMTIWDGMQFVNLDNSMKEVNGNRNFDPYRKDERFKALLKKSYLPLTHWNE